MSVTVGGIGGSVTMAGFNSKVSAWEASLQGPVADITAFDSNDWIEKYPHGIVGLSARVMGVGLQAAGATIQGSGGGFAANGYVMKFDSWNINVAATITDTTGFVDNGYQVVEPMLGTVYGTASGTCIEDDTPMDAGALTDPITPSSFLATTTITVNPGITFTGTALISNVRVSRTIMGKMVGTCTFVFTGRVTPTWAANPPFPLAAMGSQFLPTNFKISPCILTVDSMRSIEFDGVMSNCNISRSENGRCDIVYDILSSGPIEWNW